MAKSVSIQRRLIWSLSLGQVIALLLGTIGVFISIALLMSNHDGPDRWASREIEKSLSAVNGELVFTPSPQVAQWLRRNPEAWAVLRMADGRSLRHGPVPNGVLPLVQHMDVLPAGLEVSGPRAPQAFLTEFQSSLGSGKLLHGGYSVGSVLLMGLSAYFTIVFIPLLIATVLTPLVVIPLAVRRGMGGLREATAAAEKIHFGVAGERLPLTGVPTEVAPLVEAVNGALERLDIGQAQRQRFLADAAHELRTPVAILQTRLEGMPPSPETLRLQADVARLAATCEQLLDVQRLENATREPRAFDLVDLARTIAADMAPMAINAGYQIAFSSEVEHLPMSGDEAALERAAANLVRNAIEHAKGHEIRIEVFANRRLEVSDDGDGVPPAHRDQIFEPFSRVAPRSQGAGLGLTLARQIVELHGGSLTLADQGGGARFVMRL